MKTSDLIDSFINGATEGKASNLKIDDNKLINYQTCIAWRLDNNDILLNGQRYSNTTSVHQNRIRRSNVVVKEISSAESFNKYIDEIGQKSVLPIS